MKKVIGSPTKIQYVFALFSAVLIVVLTIILNKDDHHTIYLKFSDASYDKSYEFNAYRQSKERFDYLSFSTPSSNIFASFKNNKIALGEKSIWIYARNPELYKNSYVTINQTELSKSLSLERNQLLNNTDHGQLIYVGNFDLKAGQEKIEFEYSPSKNLNKVPDFGLLIFADANASRIDISSFLKKERSSPLVDLGAILILLSVSYFLLNLIYYEANFKKKSNAIFFGTVLMSLLTTSALIISNIEIPLIMSEQTNERFGSDKIIAEGLDGIGQALNNGQRFILPNNEVLDAPSDKLRDSSGVINSKVFYSPQSPNLTPVSSNIFNGYFKKIQLMASKPFILLAAILMLLLIVSAVLAPKFNGWYILAPLGIGIAISFLLSIRLSEGWDEFFINLRHSYNLLENQVYSVNGNLLIEGSVDTFPLLITALLGSMGINLVDAFIITSLAGNAIVIIFSFLILRKVTQSLRFSLLGAVLIGLYPNVLWVGGSGFTAVFFTGCIFACIYFLLYTSRPLLGYLLLGALTLVRTEGVIFTAVLFSLKLFIDYKNSNPEHPYSRQSIKNILQNAGFVFLPFIVATLIRKYFYGASLPNPIAFKNTYLDTTYFGKGIEKFLEMILNHDLHFLLLIGALLLIPIIRSPQLTKKPINALLVTTLYINGALLLSILPYYFGGGDWFPNRWNRYAMPLNLWLTLSLLCLIYEVFCRYQRGWLSKLTLLTFGIVLSCGYIDTIRFRIESNAYASIGAILNPNDHRWRRVDTLASLGIFLGKHLPSNSVIASPEEATIMYYAKKEMLGLLGVSTPEIAKKPLQPLRPGDNLHRKRANKIIEDKLPEVITLFEPAFLANQNLSWEQNLQFNAFSQDMVDIAYYRVGSYESLKNLGYRHVSLFDPRLGYSFFIQESALPAFIANISRDGFKFQGEIAIPYHVDTQITNKFVGR